MVLTKYLLTFLFLLHLKDKERMEGWICLFIYIRHFSRLSSLLNLKAVPWLLFNIHVTLCIDTFLGTLLLFAVPSTWVFARQKMKKPELSHLPFIITPSPPVTLLHFWTPRLTRSTSPFNQQDPKKVPNKPPSPVVPWTVLNRSSPEPNVRN